MNAPSSFARWQQRTHPRQQARDAAIGIGRVEQVIHRGKLERDIGAGNRAAGSLVENRPRFPLRRFAGKIFDQVGVTGRVGLRFRRIDRRLAEQIDREAEALLPQLLQPGPGVARVPADDEPLRHAAHLALDDERGD